MESGSNSMGSHKHGISGVAPKSPRYRLLTLLECQKNEKEEKENKKKHESKMFSSIKELFEDK